MSSADLNSLIREGMHQQRCGDLRGAEETYRRILAVAPDHPRVLNALASIAVASNRLDEALKLVERTVAIAPHAAAHHMNYAILLAQLGRPQEALAAAEKTSELQPGDSGPHLFRARLLIEQKMEGEGASACERVLQIDSNSYDALLLLSSLYLHLGRPLQAIAMADRALALHPDDAALHWNKALAALTAGDFETGWREYEWRQGVIPSVRRELTAPQWNHHDLAGQRILLHCEGGFGDAIQFVRFVPDVAQLTNQITLECPPELRELFASIPGVSTLVARGQALPPFDLHCPLQSVLFNLGTTLQTLRSTVPYLKVDPGKASHFREPVNRLAAWDSGRAPKLKVGLTWAGSIVQDDWRSRTLDTFAPLADAANVVFYSLQVGSEARQALRPPAGMKLYDLSAEISNFSHLAAIIVNLDLVISVDTSVAHLAGALAKPVWTLIPLVPDFRWMLGRDDSPWYPSMRLFRQVVRGNWTEPIARMVAALRKRAGS